MGHLSSHPVRMSSYNEIVEIFIANRVIHFELRFLSVKAIEHKPILLLAQLFFEVLALGMRIAAPMRKCGYFGLVHRIFYILLLLREEE